MVTGCSSVLGWDGEEGPDVRGKLPAGVWLGCGTRMNRGAFLCFLSPTHPASLSSEIKAADEELPLNKQGSGLRSPHKAGTTSPTLLPGPPCPCPLVLPTPPSPCAGVFFPPGRADLTGCHRPSPQVLHVWYGRQNSHLHV